MREWQSLSHVRWYCPGRPMRFAASVVCEYLYGRGVPGFGVPATPPPAVSKPAGS
jgi:hypothetical protein